ncbi:ribosomal protein L7/L12 [Sphingopyxis granuli]|uniref:ribosomal protein L7/L12 n=1 Tax=Sphingopyxis granuli TaxID=267128 RepID=UPI001BAFB1B2|nr:ribosomal protein L7/L12 [Sphingopyxis granuli]
MSALLLFAAGFLCGAALTWMLRRKAGRGARDLIAPPPAPRPTGRPVSVSSAPVPTGSDEEAVVELLRQNRKIEAIKLWREVTGLGLAESKAAVEALERRRLLR